MNGRCKKASDHVNMANFILYKRGVILWKGGELWKEELRVLCSWDRKAKKQLCGWVTTVFMWTWTLFWGSQLSEIKVRLSDNEIELVETLNW